MCSKLSLQPLLLVLLEHCILLPETARSFLGAASRPLK